MRRPVIGLDLALHTGWSLRDALGTLSSGVEVFSDGNRWESHGMRALRFRKWIRELLTIAGEEVLVAYERPLERAQGKRKGVTPVPVMLAGVLVSELEAAGVDYVAPVLSTVKKHATGKGNASKELMLEAARERWPGQDVEDDNQADALHVLRWTEEEIGQ